MTVPYVNYCRLRTQQGFLLIEGLVAILIFSLGILGMIAMSSTAVGAQSDAHFRTDAAKLAEDIANNISLHVARPNGVVDSADLASFAYHSDENKDCGKFSGVESTKQIVTDWVRQVETVGQGLPGLPGPSDEQIKIATGSFNQIEVTVCWRAPGTPTGTPMRRHTFVTYVN